jgi:DNA topoisomerase IA
MRLIIVEKPHAVRMIQNIVRQKWPDDELCILAWHAILSVDIVSPRNTPYSSYPMVLQPKFKPKEQSNGIECYSKLFRHVGGEWLKGESLSSPQTRNILMRAREIILAPYWDYSGVYGFHLLFEAVAPELNARNHQVIRFDDGPSEDDVRKAVANMIDTTHEQYRENLNAGLVKGYLDYNFAINSAPILGNLYRDVSKTTHPAFLSKNAMQLLWWLSEREKVKNYQIDWMMSGEKWVGTGRYEKNSFTYIPGLGSPASRQSIQKLLLDLHLIEENSGHITVSHLGKSFLARLHKDTRDLDLPFRLDRWMALPFEQAKESIDRYLLTFFGKQKRFQKV